MKISLLTLAGLLSTTISFAQGSSTGTLKPKAPEELAYENLFKATQLRRDSLKAAYQKKLKAYGKYHTDVRIEKEISAEVQAINKKYVIDHPQSTYALKALMAIDEASDVTDLAIVEPLFNGLSKKVRESGEGKAFKAKLGRVKQLAIGQMAPLFAGPDTTGRAVSLTDFRGKYVLIDFWASWCHACRLEGPNLIKAYHQYKDRNFTVLGISLDDQRAKAAWLKAIKDDALPWIQVCELKVLNGPMKNVVEASSIAQLYDIRSIPQNYLIDPEGKIIAKNLRGEQVQEALKKFLVAK